MANERKTEKLFRDELIKHNIAENNHWTVEEQQSENGLLNFKSKAGTDNSGYPEFIITNKEVDDFVIIVECKADNNDMVKYNDENKISTDIKDVKKYAVNGAYHYAKSAAENFNVVFIGVTGETTENFKYNINFLNKNELESIKLNISLSELNNIQDIINKANGNLTSLQEIHKKSKDLAADIHEFLRDKCGVSNNEKAQLIAGILLALDSDDFNIDLLKSYDTTDDEHKTDGKKILEYVILRAKKKPRMEEHKRAKLESAFAFIGTHTQLNNRSTELGMSPIKRLCEIITGKTTYILHVDKKYDLFTAIKNNQAYDILGNFYSEFVSYNGSDGNGLGIVLTPSHVTELMVKLINVNSDDALYDPCTGTGGFLVAGLNKVIEEIKHDTNTTDNEKETLIQDIKENNFIGCEIQDHMYSIAAANMILRGDGKSNLFPTSCFKQDITLKTRDKKITKSVLNPPYSQKEKELKELKFVEHALNVTEKNGLVCFIVPKSCFLDKHKKLRKDIMEKHTLEAVISMPKDLFHGSAGTEVAIGIFKAGIPHDPEVKTWLCEFDDGFEVQKHKGRNERAPRLNKVLTNKLIKHYKNKEIISGYSTTANIGLEDECLYDCHIPTEQPTESDFKRKLKDYLTFEFDNKIKEVIDE